MLVFRSMVVGLLGACCLLLAMRPQPQLVYGGAPPHILVVPPSFAKAPPPAVPAAPPVTVIDVARGVEPALLANLIVLAANEHITAIDDAPVRDARAALGSLELTPRTYIDVSIASDAGATRRVLVLPR